jgi:hypothetical protein
MARPPKYESEAEKPVNVSLRLPRDLYDQAQHHARMRRATLTELMVEGLRMRLETPNDPRDIIAAQDITAMQELERIIDARIHAALAAQCLSIPERAPGPPAQRTPPLPHGKNNTVMQRDIPGGQGVRKGGRPGILRQPILDLLRQHPEGLTGTQIKVLIQTDRHVGDTLSGMVRNKVIRKQRRGKDVRYFAMDEQPS